MDRRVRVLKQNDLVIQRRVRGGDVAQLIKPERLVFRYNFDIDSELVMSVRNLCLPTESPVIFIKFKRVLSTNANVVHKTLIRWIRASFGILDNVGTPDLNRSAYGYASINVYGAKKKRTHH